MTMAWAMIWPSDKEIKSAMFVGMISNVVTKLTKRGTKMATFTLEDTTGSIECICFKYDDYADAIQEDAIVKIKGKFEHRPWQPDHGVRGGGHRAVRGGRSAASASSCACRRRIFNQTASVKLKPHPGDLSRPRRRRAARQPKRRSQVPRRAAGHGGRHLSMMKAEIQDLFGPEAMIA